MLQSFRKFFDDFLLPAAADEAADAHEHRLRLATAALLMEMARADFAVQAVEQTHVLTLLAREFGLSQQEAARLAELGAEQAHAAVSLYEFTAAIDTSLATADKIRIIEMLWQVAYADGALDKYEEYLLRKLADLLHLSHRQLLQAKHRVLETHGQA
ncbi:MAG: TerB family tellurite resistance protein [Gammaproteobacteria bacterium]|nr:TerB family tellurite resistance protein [Gammaproteobacteria bacterium]